MKYRLERVKEVIKRELGEIIAREINFGGQLVTIQDVDITPDLKKAHIYVSVLGSEAGMKSALAKLHDKRIDLQHTISRRVILKNTPQLHFKLDATVERGSRIIDILQGLDIPEDEPVEPIHPNEAVENRSDEAVGGMPAQPPEDDEDKDNADDDDLTRDHSK